MLLISFSEEMFMLHQSTAHFAPAIPASLRAINARGQAIFDPAAYVDALRALGWHGELAGPGAPGLQASSPITGDVLFSVPEATVEQADAAIEAADEVALACHVSPDGDALGSMLALGLALRAAGRRVVASFVPIMSTILMPMRILEGEAAWWEPLVALVIAFATVALVLGLAAKIYENSLLRMGQRVKWAEALRPG